MRGENAHVPATEKAGTDMKKRTLRVLSAAMAAVMAAAGRRRRDHTGIDG